jgi:hypothetical protein
MESVLGPNASGVSRRGVSRAKVGSDGIGKGMSQCSSTIDVQFNPVLLDVFGTTRSTL